MPFEVASDVVDGGVHVLAVCGELDLETSPRFKEALEGALENGGASLLIDLTECEFIDSTGVALIVEAWHRIKERDGGGQMALCCPNAQVRRVLEITGLESSISMHTERDDALGQLRG
ncbi:MAG: STAS domain-containing protein [Actinomycetota bacterium]